LSLATSPRCSARGALQTLRCSYTRPGTTAGTRWFTTPGTTHRGASPTTRGTIGIGICAITHTIGVAIQGIIIHTMDTHIMDTLHIMDTILIRHTIVHRISLVVVIMGQATGMHETTEDAQRHATPRQHRTRTMVETLMARAWEQHYAITALHRRA
jgi:hypothetical protein